MTEETKKDYSSFYLLHFDIIPGLSFGFSNFNYPGSLFSFYFKDPRFLQRYLQLIIENEDDDEDSSYSSLTQGSFLDSDDTLFDPSFMEMFEDTIGIYYNPYPGEFKSSIWDWEDGNSFFMENVLTRQRPWYLTIYKPDPARRDVRSTKDNLILQPGARMISDPKLVYLIRYELLVRITNLCILFSSEMIAPNFDLKEIKYVISRDKTINLPINKESFTGMGVPTKLAKASHDLNNIFQHSFADILIQFLLDY